MRLIEMAEATGTLAEYAGQLASGLVVVTVKGKPVAALVPLDNTDIETASLSTNPKFLAIIERSRARQRAEGGLSREKVKRRLEKGG